MVSYAKSSNFIMTENVKFGGAPATSKDFESTKAAIFETFSKLKQWREQQVEQFRNMQRLESQRAIRLSDENQKHLQRILEQAAKSPETEVLKRIQNLDLNTSSASERNNSDSNNTLQESSITGHLQRCFDDSSQSNLSATDDFIKGPTNQVQSKNWAAGFIDSVASKPSQPVDKELSKPKDSGIKIDATKGSTKPKRPFLRKGTGLLRYMPKSATNRSIQYANRVNKKLNAESEKQGKHIPAKNLVLKPAIRNLKTFEHDPVVLTESAKHIRFDIPSEIVESDISTVESASTAATSKANDNQNFQQSFRTSIVASNDNSEKNKLDLSISGSESLDLSKENKDLEEFELLENCAQNSSFNSDSSVVQRVLHGANAKNIITQKRTTTVPPQFHIRMNTKLPPTTDNPIFSAKLGLDKCMEEVQARKQILQKVISDINPRIQSLQKEITNFNDESFNDSDVSERCSTPLEDSNVEERVSPPVVPVNNYLDRIPEFPDPSTENAEDNCGACCKSCDVNGVLHDLYPNGINPEQQISICESADLSPENNSLSEDRKKIREKVQELENEIRIYQGHNAKIAAICKERDEILKKLQKERDDFNKYKEAEKKKLEAEMEQERKQIRRQKETFTRYQKLRKDNPTRKEREELNALRQEVEKLQEELKRQRIKYTSDSRRWKNQIDAAEKERDSFKLENIRLEEQVQDLLTALKTRMKKSPPMRSLPLEIVDEENDNMIEMPLKNITESSHTIPKEIATDLPTKPDKVISAASFEKKTKSKVRFNFTKSNQNEKVKNVKSNDDNFVDNISETTEETVSDSETRKATESHKTAEEPLSAKNLLDDKEIAEDTVSDSLESTDHYENVNQDEKENDFLAANISTITVSVEADYKEIDHGNKIERIHYTGEREIIFNSGTRKIISADGKSTKFMFYNGDTKEIFSDKREIYRYVNGVVETRFPDGLEVTEFPNGQIQRRYPDGQKEVKFPDGTMHNIYADGSEEIRSTEGNVVSLSADGTETIEFANGQREIRTATYKRREFPDGSVKIVHDSGRVETRYADGRIRIKDKDGKVIVDTKYLSTLKD